MKPHIELFEAVDETERLKTLDYRWRLKAGNGEIVASGEGYTRMADAERGAREMIKTACLVAADLVLGFSYGSGGSHPEDDVLQLVAEERV
jgi:uncharacterized protein YegP (UPF0339 family)